MFHRVKGYFALRQHGTKHLDHVEFQVSPLEDKHIFSRRDFVFARLSAMASDVDLEQKTFISPFNHRHDNWMVDTVSPTQWCIDRYANNRHINLNSDNTTSLSSRARSSSRPSLFELTEKDFKCVRDISFHSSDLQMTLTKKLAKT